MVLRSSRIAYILFIVLVSLGIDAKSPIYGAKKDKAQQMPSGFYYPTSLAWTGIGDTQQPPGKANLFGWLATDQDNPAYPTHNSHRGIDIYGASSSPVYAVTSGVIACNDTAPSSYMEKDLWVMHDLKDGSYFYVVYGHVNSSLTDGTVVTAGQQIATIAPQSNSHTHLGIHPAGVSYPWGRGTIPDGWKISNDPDKSDLPLDGWVAPRTYLETHNPPTTSGAQSDSAPPKISFGGADTSNRYNSPEVVTWNVTDSDSRVKQVMLQWDSDVQVLTTPSGNATIPLGTHTITIYATDRAGNTESLSSGPYIFQAVILSVSSSTFLNRFYVQQIDRSGGIRIESGIWSDMTLTENDSIYLVGGTVSIVNGEKVWIAPTIQKVGSSSPARALYMTIRSIVNEPNSLGTLIKTSGKVVQVDPSGNYFYLDDGSGITDGLFTGIRVICDGFANNSKLISPESGKFVAVTGISSVALVSGNAIRVIRPRRQSDITSLS